MDFKYMFKTVLKHTEDLDNSDMNTEIEQYAKTK